MSCSAASTDAEPIAADGAFDITFGSSIREGSSGRTLSTWYPVYLDNGPSVFESPVGALRMILDIEAASFSGDERTDLHFCSRFGLDVPRTDQPAMLQRNRQAPF